MLKSNFFHQRLSKVSLLILTTPKTVDLTLIWSILDNCFTPSHLPDLILIVAEFHNNPARWVNITVQLSSHPQNYESDTNMVHFGHILIFPSLTSRNLWGLKLMLGLLPIYSASSGNYWLDISLGRCRIMFKSRPSTPNAFHVFRGLNH